MDEQVRVELDEPAHEYVISVDGRRTGYAHYRPAGDRLVFDHTVIDPEFGGRGLATRLIGAALDDVRSRGQRIVAQCPFVARFVERHPDYEDLLAA